MNKKSLVSILIIIIVIFAGVIIWQYSNSKSINKDKTIVPINSSSKNVENVSSKIDEKTTINTDQNTIKKITAPAKDEEALKSNFTYEVPLSKVLDKKWQWVEAVNYDDSVFTPQKINAFSLTLNKDGSFTGTTDCNSIFGKYTVKGSNLAFSSVGQTMMFCEGSEEIKFTTYLSEIRNFKFNGEENLVLGFEFNSGSMIFK